MEDCWCTRFKKEGTCKHLEIENHRDAVIEAARELNKYSFRTDNPDALAAWDVHDKAVQDLNKYEEVEDAIH